MKAYRHITIVLSLLLLSVLAHAQTEWTVLLNGKVLEDGKPLSRAILILKKNGEEIQKVVTAPNGKFNITLESANDYELYFTKRGYVTKFISYSTKNVPEDKIAGIYSEFIFELELFKEMEGLNTSILEFPVFKVKYYPGLKNLDYDKKHESKVKSRMNALLKEYKTTQERIAKDAGNAEELKRKQKLEQAYNDQLAVADVLFKEKKYEESQDAYEQALVILPNKDFPRDKIVAIEKLIKIRDKTRKLPKQMKEQYANLINLADAAFIKGKYTSSKSLYKRASLIAPNRPYPKAQIALAEDEIAKSQAVFSTAKNEKYKIIIDRADNEFMGEDYVRARASYLSALRVKPEETHPKMKMDEIDSISAANKVVAIAATPINDKKPKDKKGGKENVSASGTEDNGMEAYLLALASEYDEGITEEIEVTGDKQVTRIIVVKAGVANEYKKEVFSWATYYKKNNKTIPRYIFENETKR